MSYNPDPEWTEAIELPPRSALGCPYCGKAPSSRDPFVMIKEIGYYNPRHIPPYLLLTCENSECSHCDESYRAYLTVTVKIQKIVPDGGQCDDNET